MYSFKSAGYLQEGEATREKGRPAGLISSPSDLILKDRLSFPFDSLHCFGASKHPMESSERMLGFSSSVFRAKPSLEVLEVLVHILTEVNMQVAVLPRISGFLMRELPTPPQLAVAVMKGKQMQNEESRLQELFRSLCPGRMFGETGMARNKKRSRIVEYRDVT